MEVRVILQKDRYALIERVGKEYVIACGFNGSEWNQGYYFTYWNKTGTPKAICLSAAVDYFRYLTEDNYIPRCRLEELATYFKDGLIEDDADSAMEYFDTVCEMIEKEKEYFGIETESEEK